MSDLVSLIAAESGVPEPLRSLALRSLAVQLADRGRHAAIIAAINSGGQSGFLSLLLHRSIASLVAQAQAAETAAAAAAAAAAASSGGAAGAAGGSEAAQPPPAAAAAAAAASAPPAHTYSLEFVESLLVLVQSLVTSTAGGTALADAGVAGALLPLLRLRGSDHVGLVTAAVRVLEGYIDFAAGTATAAFGDASNGLQELINRLVFEVGLQAGAAAGGAAGAAGAAAVEGAGVGGAAEGAGAAVAAAAAPAGPAATEAAAELAAAAAGGCLAQRQAAEKAAAAAAAAAATAAGTSAAGASSGEAAGTSAATPEASAAASPPKVPYARTTLIKFLLRCLALACFSPQSTAASRPPEGVLQALYRSLGVVLRDGARFGGSLFALAATVVSDCLHADPLQYRLLEEAGLPQAYLEAVKVGLLRMGFGGLRGWCKVGGRDGGQGE